MFVSFEIDESLLEKITFRKSFIREHLKKMWKKETISYLELLDFFEIKYNHNYKGTEQLINEKIAILFLSKKRRF